MGGKQSLAGAAFGGVELIRFCSDDDAGQPRCRQIAQHGAVVLGGADAAVDQLHDQRKTVKAGIFSEIAVGQRTPLCLVLRGALSKSVAGQIDQKQLLVDVVEVDGNGLAGGCADAR